MICMLEELKKTTRQEASSPQLSCPRSHPPDSESHCLLSIPSVHSQTSGLSKRSHQLCRMVVNTCTVLSPGLVNGPVSLRVSYSLKRMNGVNVSHFCLLASICFLIVPNVAALLVRASSGTLPRPTSKNWAPLSSASNLPKGPDEVDQRVDYENVRQGMISRLTPQSLRNIVRQTQLGALKRVYVEDISADVEMQLMATINKMQSLDRIELYHTFAFVPATRVIYTYK